MNYRSVSIHLHRETERKIEALMEKFDLSSRSKLIVKLIEDEYERNT